MKCKKEYKKYFFKSKVAGRIFFLFIFCALFPLFIIAGLTYKSVNNQLSQQAITKLRQSSRLKGMEIYSRLFSLEMALKMVTSVLVTEEQNAEIKVLLTFEDDLKRDFNGLMAVTGKDERIPILNTIKEIPDVSFKEQQHMNLGRTLVVTRYTSNEAPRIFMVRLIDPEDPEGGLLFAELKTDILWGVDQDEGMSTDVPLFILSPNKDLLFSSIPDFQLDQDILNLIANNPMWGDFEFQYAGESYLAGYRSMFLKYHFFTPGWIIIMGQARSIVFEPTAYFSRIFFLLVLLTFFTVCLLSVILIRKSLVPIERLRATTQKIANGEYGTKVDIKSGDEFESLGEAFNEMSRKLEEGRQLFVQSAKMGAMGQMAAGIVHEIGQPMTTIYGLIELLLMENPDEDSRKHLKIIQKQMDRLRDIIKRFRIFTRVSKEELVHLSINEEIKTTHELLEHQLQMKHIGWEFKKEEGLPSILGDQNMLQQVLTNLIINAMDALEEKGGNDPEIRVRTYKKDHQVFVDIEDNGSGIPKEIQSRIFDPFFTTKSEDKGTGLGLAIIDSIIHQHNARITLESETGVGTKFIIAFAAIQDNLPPQ